MDNTNRYPTIAVQAITEVTGLSKEELQSTTRKFKCVIARQIVFEYLIRKQLSTSQIGKVFNRDHATVLHGVKQIRGLLKHDKEIRFIKHRFDALVAQFESGEDIVIGTA